MIEENLVVRLVDEAVSEDQNLFLIDLKIDADSKINVVVDGDHGVTVKDCIRISRHIEHNLDRETTDFSLEVSSPGATEPLINRRQYKKNIGRTLEIRTETEKFEGLLTKASDIEITLEWKVREPKPIGKGKVTVLKTAVVAFTAIKQAKVKIKF